MNENKVTLQFTTEQSALLLQILFRVEVKEGSKFITTQIQRLEDIIIDGNEDYHLANHITEVK